MGRIAFLGPVPQGGAPAAAAAPAVPHEQAEAGEGGSSPSNIVPPPVVLALADQESGPSARQLS